MVLDPALSNVITKYFQLQGVRFDSRDPVHRELMKRNLKEAKTVLRMANNNITVAYQKMGEVAAWAESKGLDWALSTVVKRWLSNNSVASKHVYKDFHDEEQELDRSRISEGLQGIRDIMKKIKDGFST